MSKLSKRQQVRYEFFTFENTNPLGETQYTLKIENPAKIIFTFLSVFPGARVVINKNYYLNSVSDTTSGVAQYPNTLVLENNENEIDITIYSVLVGIGTLSVVCKYYID